MNVTKKFMFGAVIALMIAGVSHAGKWKELVFAEDVNMTLAELSQYCMLHDITVADVLWANSIESGDIKPGQSVYLPVNQADMLAIWQNKGAWKPTALVPVTSAAAAKRAVKDAPKPEEISAPKVEVPAPKVKAPSPKVETPAPKLEAPAPKIETPAPKVPTAEPKLEAPAPIPAPKVETKSEVKDEAGSVDDIMAKLREDVKNSPVSAPLLEPAKTASTPAPVQPVKTASTPAPKKQVSKQETPAKVIANTAKPDKILTSKKGKSKNEIPGLMDPIIILSPNGDPSKGPMRLVISGDKVEVVQLPQNAAPRRPSLSDLDHTFGTYPSYLPHYNMTAKPRDPFILNMGSLRGKMLWPVDGKVSSPFGRWRGNHKHQGIDIPMPAGTPIRAARNGVVSRTGNNSTMGFRGYGNFVLMDHGDGLQTFYAHCSSVAVVQGQRVMQGQIVGYVGSTGRSTANHLHFEVRINSTKVDPIPYLGGNTHLASHK